MSFHVRSTKDDFSGKTEITEVVMGDDSVVFQRRVCRDGALCIDVTLLTMLAPEAIMLTLTPAEAEELVKRLSDMLENLLTLDQNLVE